jgi:hypothetical protein
MVCLHGIAFLFRRLAWLALLGFGALFLSGPVLALLSLLLALTLSLFALMLPWVLLGLVFWVPFRALSRGSRAAWQDMRENTRGLCRKAVVLPVRTGVHVYSHVAQLGKRTGDRVYGASRFAGAVIVEALSGALVGALIGALFLTIGGMAPHPQTLPMVLGAAIGGFLGVVVGVSRAGWTKESLANQASESMG